MPHQSRTIAAFLVTLLLTASLIPAETAWSQAGAASPPVKIKVLNLPFLTFAPLYFAQEEGYFAEQNLEVEMVSMQSTAEGIALLTHGDVDVAAGVVDLGLFNALARGAAIKIVADKGYLDPAGCTAVAFLARADLLRSGRLKEPADLKGLKISVRPANIESFFLEQLVEKSGVAFSDLDRTSLDMKVRLDMTAAGRMDVFFATEPWIARSTVAGAAATWVDLGKRFPGFQHAGVFYGKKLLENREAGNRFMIAYLKGVRQYNRGLTPRNLELMSKLTGLDRDLLSRTCLQSIHPDGSIDRESLMELQSWGVKNKLLDAVVPPEQFWDGGFIEYADKALVK